MDFIDTHAHLDGEEFLADSDEVMARALAAGVSKVFVPAISLASLETVTRFCAKYKGRAYPMIGLHPEEVTDAWKDQLAAMRQWLKPGNRRQGQKPGTPFIAIGEVGLDYYWSREYEREQLAAFEEQVKWAVEFGLPLMIHCRKGQNEMVHLLKDYEDVLPGGVFHCFTGNEREAEELLQFDRFVLGIGGVLTFKKSHLPEVLPSVVPLDRIVLETDSPYMAPVPMRGQRNESAFVAYVLKALAACYQVSEDVVAATTNANVKRVFGI